MIAHTSWIGRDGAPANISALAQTTDGYLWLGTPLGLYRFDGLQFANYPTTPLEATLPSTDIESLYPDLDGGLWIGFRIGGITHLAKDGTLVNYNARNGRGPSSAQKFVIRDDKRVWAIGDNKLLTLQGNRWEDFGGQHGLPSDQIFALFFDKNGSIWTSARHKLFVFRKNGKAFELYSTETFMVVDFAEMPDGQLWVSDGWHSIRPLVPDKMRPAIPVNGYVRMVTEPSGTLWMAQDYRGVSHVPWLPNQSVRLAKESELSSEQTNAIFRDRDGDIWVGTSRGLDRFQSSAFQSLSNVRVEYYPSLAQDTKSGVWIATLAHPILHSSGGTLAAVGPEEGSSPIICDDNGRIWIVDPIKNALVEYDHDTVLRVPIPDAVHLAPAESIGLDRDGILLVSFKEGGLWRFDGQWQQVHYPKLPDDDPLSIVRDASRRVWLGYADSIIVMRDENGVHTFTAQQGANLGNVLTFTASRNRLWAAGTNGLAYFDGGSFHRILLQREGVLRGVSGVVEDKAGNLWLNASNGIIRIAEEELQKISPQHSTLDYDLFDDRQGIVGTATQMRPTPSAVADKDGPLWFSTSGAVYSISPDKPSLRRSVPTVTLQNVAINGRSVLDREHGVSQLEVSAGDLKELEVNYIGLDLSAPEKVTYKYILEGSDRVWHDVGTRRQAFYNNLDPGTYRFRVQATNGSGQWSELLTPFLFKVTPAFYQTYWFYAICAVLTLALLYLGYLLRVQYVTRRLSMRLKERSDERLRIARELHDTLLQSVHGLMLRFHFATEDLSEDEPARKPLLKALSRADEVFVEARRRIEYLRDQVPEGADFADQLAKLGEELEIQKVMAFRVVENGQPQYLNSDVQEELYKIAREALINTLHHSKATSAEVSLIYEPSEFLMKACDTGLGLPPAILNSGSRTGHWGLVGMRERVSAIDGRLEPWSVPGGGTEIEVHVPAKRAYRYPTGRSMWLQRLLQFRRDATGRDITQ